MRSIFYSFAAAVLAVPVCTLAQAGQQAAPAEVLNHLLSGEEREFVAAAEAMPADKFNYAPPASAGKFEGVRSFAGEVKHITEGNYMILRSLNVPGAKSRDEIENLSDREKILAALKQSFTYAHTALETITLQNAFTVEGTDGSTRAAAAIHLIAHLEDHYGQMVVYLRMNGVVPPASRK